MSLLLFGPLSANADTFNWSYSGSGFSGSGQLDATFVSGSEWLVTSISGISDGSVITGLLPVGASGNDNLLFFPNGTLTSSSPNLVDDKGIAWSTGALPIALALNGSLDLVFDDNCCAGLVTFTVSTTRRTPALRNRSRRVGPAWLAQKTCGCPAVADVWSAIRRDVNQIARVEQ